MGWDPSIDDLVRVKQDLLYIGPLDCNSEFGLTGEAFFTFSFREETFDWIKKHFKMVRKIKDSADYSPVEVLKEEKVKFKTEKEFSDWFKIGKN